MEDLKKVQDGCVKDKLWIWGHEAGSHNEGWGIPMPSRMTPVEGAFYLGVPNIIMIRYDGKPPIASDDQYIVPFRALKRVVWSITGAGGATSAEEIKHAFELAARNPNVTGFFMDDFFKGDGEGALTVEGLWNVRSQLTLPERKLDLMVTLYDGALDTPAIVKYLELCDKIALWTWVANNLEDLERNFEKCEKISPGSDKLLGCYMWDYGTHKPMPVDLMEMQCEMGLRWLREGRIDGMIFLASCICDLDLDAVEWTRSWITGVGDKKVSAGA